MWIIIRTFAWHFRVQSLIVTAAFGADAAWNFAGAFWGFTVLVLAMAQFGCWMATSASKASTKAQTLETKLNTVVIPRLPFPQPTPGAGGNSSFGPSNTSFNSGNNSFGIAGGNQTFGAGTTWSQAWGNAVVNTISTLYGAFNALQPSYSNTVSAFNNHIGDHGNLVNCVSSLRSSYSNSVTDHNAVVTKLTSANILQ